MVFPSAHLPPSSSHFPPITSTLFPPSFNRPSPSPAPPPQSLLASIPTLLLLIKTVLTARASAGDLFLSIAASSTSALDLHAVLRAVPTPPSATTALPPSFYSAVYAAALHPTAPSCAAAIASPVAPFSTHTPLPVVHALVDRLGALEDISPAIFVTALLYFDRLAISAPHFIVTSANIHALFAVAFLLAAKFHEDDFYSTAFYARLFGIPLSVLADLEAIFLRAISFRLFVSTDQYAIAEQAVIAQALDSPHALSVLKSLCKAHVSSVDAAFPILRSWLVLHASPPRRDGTVCWTPPNSTTSASESADDMLRSTDRSRRHSHHHGYNESLLCERRRHFQAVTSSSPLSAGDTTTVTTTTSTATTVSTATSTATAGATSTTRTNTAPRRLLRRATMPASLLPLSPPPPPPPPRAQRESQPQAEAGQPQLQVLAPPMDALPELAAVQLRHDFAPAAEEPLRYDKWAAEASIVYSPCGVARLFTLARIVRASGSEAAEVARTVLPALELRVVAEAMGAAAVGKRLGSERCGYVGGVHIGGRGGKCGGGGGGGQEAETANTAASPSGGHGDVRNCTRRNSYSRSSGNRAGRPTLAAEVHDFGAAMAAAAAAVSTTGGGTLGAGAVREVVDEPWHRSSSRPAVGRGIPLYFNEGIWTAP